MQNLPWIVALVSVALLAFALGVWGWSGKKAKPSPALPTDWALAARPVFSGDERRVHRLLREALPHHVVLSKLPLVRFCQPTDPNEVRYWYDLLGNSHVTFALCSANGRVLAAVDLDSDRTESRRRMQIKQSVLSACRVRYLRCDVDHLPSAAELQLLVPSATPAARAPLPSPAVTRDVDGARARIASRRSPRRHEHKALWQDSAVLQDSFFTPDSGADAYGRRPDRMLDGQPHLSAPAAAAAGRGASHFSESGFDEPDFRYTEFELDPTLDESDNFGGVVDRAPPAYPNQRC